MFCAHRFPSSSDDRNTEVYFVFGVKSVDRDGVLQLFDPKNLGKVEWRANFVPNAAMQNHILRVCEDTAALDFVARDDDNPVLGVVRV